MNIGFIGLGNMGRGMALNLVKANHKVKVYDILGKLMDEIKINNNELIYYNFNQPEGVYMLSILIDGKTHIKKIVKQ